MSRYPQLDSGKVTSRDWLPLLVWFPSVRSRLKAEKGEEDRRKGLLRNWKERVPAAVDEQ